MLSSPTERLERIAQTYDAAFEAAQQQDYDRVSKLLEVVNELLAATVDAGDPAEIDAAKQRAQTSHGRLLSTMHTARNDTMVELRQVRTGRRVIKNYGGRAPVVATRLDREL